MRIAFRLWEHTIRLPAVVDGYGGIEELCADLEPGADPERRASLYRRLVDDVQAGRHRQIAINLLLYGQRQALMRIDAQVRSSDVSAAERRSLIMCAFCEVVHRIGPRSKVGPALCRTVKTRVIREMKRRRRPAERLKAVADELQAEAEACGIVSHVADPVEHLIESQHRAGLPQREDIDAWACRAGVTVHDAEMLWRVHAEGVSHEDLARESVRGRRTAAKIKRETIRLRKRGDRARKRLVEHLDEHPDSAMADTRDNLRGGRTCRPDGRAP